jgi:hypothetical protein
VNTHCSVVIRLRASGAVTALACKGRLLSCFFCQYGTSGDVSRPVIDIWRGAQFVMDINTVGCVTVSLACPTLNTDMIARRFCTGPSQGIYGATILQALFFIVH